MKSNIIFISCLFFLGYVVSIVNATDSEDGNVSYDDRNVSYDDRNVSYDDRNVSYDDRNVSYDDRTKSVCVEYSPYDSFNTKTCFSKDNKELLQKIYNFISDNSYNNRKLLFLNILEADGANPDDPDDPEIEKEDDSRISAHSYLFAITTTLSFILG